MPDLYNLTGSVLNQTTNREHDPHVRLAATMLTTAYRDLVDKNKRVRRKARRFFTSRAFETWADMAHLEYETVMDGYRNVLRDGLPGDGSRRERYRKGW